MYSWGSLKKAYEFPHTGMHAQAFFSRTCKSCVCVSGCVGGLQRHALIASQAGNNGLKSPTLFCVGAGKVHMADPAALASLFPAQLPSATCPGAYVLLSHSLPCLLLLFIYS